MPHNKGKKGRKNKKWARTKKIARTVGMVIVPLAAAADIAARVYDTFGRHH